jgi:hypothetical protein
MHTKFYLENLIRRSHLGDLVADGSIISKWGLKKSQDVWTEFIWLRIGSNGMPN